jgi:hypothetical protein
MDESNRLPRSTLDAAVWHALDACRPGSDDAAELLTDVDRQAVENDPKCATWRRRSEAFDRAVARAYADVPVPEGLAARLQATLEAAALETAAVAEATQVAEVATDESAVRPQPARLDRRRWLTAAGSAMAATAAGWGLLVWWRGRERDVLTTEELLHEVLALHQRTADRAQAATPVSRKAAPAEFPPSPRVRREAELRWRPLDETLLGRRGAAYELSAPGAPRAVLYVLAMRGESGSPELPPLATDSTAAPASTGGCSLGVWREDDRVVVLVVEGDERRYRNYVAQPAVIA